MADFTSQYAELQRELHAREPSYGTSGFKHAQHILDIAQRLGTREILDWGCGKQTLQKNLPFPITNYDPFIAGCDTEPDPHDMVVCGDVLEHIEPDCLSDVLSHIHSKTKCLLFVDVATRLAKKTLANGQNAHLIVESPTWWLQKLMTSFDVKSFQVYEGGFVGVFTPCGKAECDR